MVSGAVCAAMILLSACAPAGESTKSSTNRSASSGPVNVEQLSVSSLAGVMKLRAALRRARNEQVAECMANKGFPQLSKAQQNAMTTKAVVQNWGVNLAPLNFGPYTKEQAREYGMIGSQLVLQG